MEQARQVLKDTFGFPEFRLTQAQVCLPHLKRDAS